MEGEKEPSCEGCYVELLPENQKIWKIYLLCRTQVRLSGMGDLIGLDNAGVLASIKIYCNKDEQQKMFEDILDLFNIEREVSH